MYTYIYIHICIHMYIHTNTHIYSYYQNTDKVLKLIKTYLIRKERVERRKGRRKKGKGIKVV